MIPSDLAKRVEPSKGRWLFNMASEYDEVINLTLGDPDMVPPVSIRNAACDAIMQGKTRYSANAGIPQLRTIYSQYIESRYGKIINPDSQIIVTVGGMEALYLAIISSVNPGDEVIIFEPYYINYYQMIKMCGAIPVVLKTEEKDGFVPSVDLLKEKIGRRTKLIILNSPANPTGAIYSESITEGIIRVAKDCNVLIISDEVYSTLVYDNEKHFSVFESGQSYENIMRIDSCSKRYAMTGWRIGFAVGPEEWIDSMIKLQENVAACAPLPSQYAAYEAFKNLPDMSAYIGEFKERRDLLAEILSKSDRLKFFIPKGTFYLFINIANVGMKSMEFSVKLLQAKHVAVVPGIAYGDHFDNYIRIAFTLDKSMLLEAANRIVAFSSQAV